MTSTVEPCFTLSTGRSGTMTLALLGALSPCLASVHEPHPRLLVESCLRYRGDVADDAFWDAVVGEARDRPIENAQRRGRSWFETNNRLTFLAPVLARRYPRSKFIVLVRHPEDFAESAMARGYYERHPWDFARITPRPADPHSGRWSEMSRLERIGWLWQATYSTIDDLVTSVDADRVMTLRSEDLFDDRREYIPRLFAFAGASATPARSALDRVLASRANAQLDRGPGSRRQEWDNAHHELFLAQVEHQMRRYGFAPR